MARIPGRGWYERQRIFIADHHYYRRSPSVGCASARKLAGLALAEGKVLWSQEVPAFRGMNIITPTIVNDVAFASTYGGKTNGYRIVNKSGNAEDPRLEVETAWTEASQGYM